MKSQFYKNIATLTAILVWIFLIIAWWTGERVLNLYFAAFISSCLTVIMLSLYRFYQYQDYKSQQIWRVLCIILGTPLTLLIVFVTLVLMYNGKMC